MGSRIQKIAFIIFALLFVAIMAVMNSTVLNLGTNGNKQLSTTLQTSDTASLEVYNDATVSGSTVLNAAKNPSSVSSTNLTIGVVTKAVPGTVKAYATTTGNDENAFGVSTEKYVGSTSDGSAINSGASFHSYLVNNANGVVSGILFVQENAVSDTDALKNFIASGYSCSALGVED